MPIANILEPLVDAEEWLLEGLHSIGLAWGLAIVVLTLVVRTSIVPLTIRQFRAQRELAVHLPELRRLHERHAKDPERLRREIAPYYAEHRVNPLALFLPILVQIPVFLSLYFLMREDVANGLFHHAGFLFIADLTARPHGAVLVLCYLASQLASSAVARRTLAGKHRKLMLAMPVLFLGVATRVPRRTPRLLDRLEPVDPWPTARAPADTGARGARRRGQRRRWRAAERGMTRWQREAPGRQREHAMSASRYSLL